MECLSLVLHLNCLTSSFQFTTQSTINCITEHQEFSVLFRKMNFIIFNFQVPKINKNGLIWVSFTRTGILVILCNVFDFFLELTVAKPYEIKYFGQGGLESEGKDSTKQKMNCC